MKARQLLLLVLVGQSLVAQEPDVDIRSVGEVVADAGAAELETQQLQLEYYRSHPLDMNRATADELADLGLLNALQIAGWMQFRAVFGPATDWTTFQSVPGWSESVVIALKPYVQLRAGALKWRDIIGGSSDFLLYRINWEKGRELPAGSLGGASQELFRYQFSGARASRIGLLMEKDAGEPTWKKGPDFWSVHLSWKGPRGVGWLLGDYSIQFGQGLSCWQSMRFGAGSDLTAIKRQGSAMRPYQSVGESRFMRGMAVGRMEGWWQWNVFLSLKQQSATLYQRADLGVVFRTVDVSGLHRTPLERGKKNDLNEYTAGGRVGRYFSFGRFFFNVIARRWSIPRMDFSDPAASVVSLEHHRLNATLDAAITSGPVHAFGEWAMDGSGKMAGVAGAVMALSRSFDLSLHVRRIGMGYRSVDGQAFQQATTVQAERGYYAQLQWRIGTNSIIDAHADFYSRPGAADGRLFLLGLVQGIKWQYQPDKKTLLYLRVQSQQLEKEGGAAALPGVIMHFDRSIRLHGQVTLNENFKLAFRAEEIRTKEIGRRAEFGFLTYAELRFEPSERGFRADIRCMWVSSDGWDSRIYAYERDVLYKTGFPAFSGNQWRSYLNLTLPVSRNMTIWAKFNISKVFDNQLIEGNMIRIVPGFTIQVRYRRESSPR